MGGEGALMSEDKFIYWRMLMSPTRQYVIEKVKAPMLKAICILAKRYPEPTRENCINPNTQRLLDIRDKFFKCERNLGRDALFRAIWQMFIVEYEHDPYYRQRINRVKRWMDESDWDDSEQPQECWKEKR